MKPTHLHQMKIQIWKKNKLSLLKEWNNFLNGKIFVIAA